MIGSTISHYKILEELGRGGMGVVYKAEDTKLDRLVALKFLPMNAQPTAADIARFRFEAKALASLNHPNIATIFDFDQHNDDWFIAIELIPGGTLSEKLRVLAAKEQHLSLTQIVDHAIQLARGLAHAHRRGVIHRDVKTENVMLTDDGEVKLADFGLAKLRHITSFTNPGSVIGTASYMSPEQIRAEEIDHRTDIWSLGVVLYEMVTMRLPFRGEHEVAMMYSIVNEEPVSVRSLRSEAPPSIENVILRCLKKDRNERYQSAEELIKDLQEIQRELSGAPVAFSPPRHVTVKQLTFGDTVEEYPSWSSGGARIVFCREAAGSKKLFVRNLDDGKERQLTKGSFDDLQPEWSRDGKTILFVRSHQPNGKLEPIDIFSQYEGGDVWRLDLDSGKENMLIENAFNPALSPDGSWIAVDASRAGPRRIWLFDQRGRNPRQLTSDVSEAVAHIRPRWSPDGTKIVFQNVERVKFDIRTIDLRTGEMDWLTDDMVQDVYPVWSPSGGEIFFSSFRSGGLNLWSLSASARLGADRTSQLTTGAGQDVHAAVSPDGRQLVYASMRLNADIWRLPVDPSTGKPAGNPEALIVSSREDSRGAWSSDGRRIAFNSDRGGEMNVWVFSIQDKSLVQLTHGVGGDFQPNWSPDGRSIVFFSMRSGRPDLWRVELDTGQVQQLTSDPSLKVNPFYSPDGRFIAYHCDAAGRLEPWTMRSDGTEQRKLADMEVMGHFMRWSADGRTVLFRSPNPSRPGIWAASIDEEEPAFVCVPKGGSHISLSADHRLIADVVDHKELWVTPVDGSPSSAIFKFADPQVRIDYPVWSPDGNWVLFDYVKPSGGNLWLMGGLG